MPDDNIISLDDYRKSKEAKASELELKYGKMSGGLGVDNFMSNRRCSDCGKVIIRKTQANFNEYAKTCKLMPEIGCGSKYSLYHYEIIPDDPESVV